MKVLILSCNTGGGHNSAARAIRTELLARGIECEIADALAFGPQYFSETVSGLHTLAYRYFPTIYGIGYRKKEKFDPSERVSFEYKVNSICVPRLYRYLCRNHFNTVITPHVFPGEMMTRLHEKYPARFKTYFIATDYTCSPCVNEIRPDWWIIPDERLRPEFVGKGIPSEKIKAFGIPTAAHFEHSIPKAAARHALHLPAEGPLVLIMSGSIGCGPLESLSRRILRHLPEDATAVTLCGNNQKLYHELSSLAKKRPGLCPVQFTDRMDLYLSAADVVVTKPGGLSSTEIALKGVPTVLLLAVPGCESRNLVFLCQNGMALAADTVRDAIRAVQKLIGSEAARNAMLKAQESLPRGAAKAICDLVIEEAKQDKEPCLLS